jgi:hypothetical protein
MKSIGIQEGKKCRTDKARKLSPCISLEKLAPGTRKGIVLASTFRVHRFF